MTIPSDLFTPESMFTLAGATVITTLVTDSFQHAFNWNPKWLGLIVAIFINVAGVAFSTDPKPVNYFVGIINGFLVYASATGIMQMTGTTPPPSGTKSIGLKEIRRRFPNKWY
jgi:hypothetical protein